MRKIISRPLPERVPDFPMPVHVRSSGYNEAEFGWKEFFPAREKPFVQLFWTIQGTGRFLLPGKEILLRPGETFVHLPGEDHVHSSADPSGEWKYYWFTMDGPAAASFFNAYGYPRAAMPSGICPTRLFLELETLVQKNTPYARRHALAVAAEILALAGGTGEKERERSLSRRYRDEAIAALQDPSVTVAAIARKLGLHRTTLTVLFRKETGMTPGEYLLQQRIQHALVLLKQTDLPVKETAEHSGFRNVSHFCKVIASVTGMSPKQYRLHQKKSCFFAEK